MFRFVFGVFGALFSAFTIGLVFAAFGVGGVIYMYSRDLPDHETLARYNPATLSRIYSGEGEIMDEFARPGEVRIYVPAEEIPDVVMQAVISAEDRNFFEHGGFDPRAIAAAVYEAVVSRGRDVRGASTITQQVAKNLLLDSSRTIERKIREIILAVRIEQIMSKEQIIEVYLNEIEFGFNAHGIAAAARTYFNASLEELRPEQAALLAGLPQNPALYNPTRFYDQALTRRNFVLREMWENGFITEAEYERAREAPIETVMTGEIDAFQRNLPPRSYFTDEIRRQLSSEFGEEQFFSA
ncbi:MAG: transglycosylase domain-containing protein, partial [Pseudomonadota bacterium]